MKKMKKVLSLVLVLIMVLSLFPVSAFAEFNGMLGSIWEPGEDIEPLPLPTTLPEVEEPEEEEAVLFDSVEQTFYVEDENGVAVDVEAPAGALPMGADLVVSSVAPETIQADVDALLGAESNVLLAMDISFVDENGVEVHPAADVKVMLSGGALADKENLQVVHFPDETLEPELVTQLDANDVAFEYGTNVAFQSKDFSVYAVIDPEDEGPVRATYYFKNADGSQYFFKNTAGQDVDNQIIKDGEYLEDVGTPVILGNQTFLGWFVYENNEYGEQIKFGAENPIPVTAEDDYDVIVRAKYDNVLYATFYKEANGGVVLDRQQIVTDASGKGYVDIKSMTATAPLSTQAFVGWATTPDATEEIKDSALTDGKYEITADTSFYPVFKNAHWIRFWASERGAGATYTGPAFVLAEHQAIEGKPEKDPTWSGYVFKYWSDTKPTYDDEGHVTNGAEEFNWNQELTEDITLYAVWEYAVAKYTVMFYKQVATDDAGLEDSAKHYEYDHSETRETVKGSTVVLSNADKNAPEGFVFNANKSTASEVAEANGTTVLYVYYDRIAYTLNFVAEGSSYDDYVLVTNNNDYTTPQYALVNGVYKELTLKTESTTEYFLSTSRTGNNPSEYTGQVYDSNHNPVSPPYDRNKTYYSRSGFWPLYNYSELYWRTRSVTTRSWELDGETYTGARYKIQATTTHTVKTIVALYEHSIKDEFPIVGKDGTSYEGWSWTDSGNPKVYNYVLQTIESMPAANVTFVGSQGSAVKTIYYYVEVVKGEDLTGATTKEFNNKTYKLYKTVTHNFNFLTYDEEYHPIEGFDRDRSHAEPAFGSGLYHSSNGGEYNRGGWALESSSDRDPDRAPIPNYATYQYTNNYGQRIIRVYHHNNGSGFSYVAPSDYSNYKDEWVNYLYYDRKSYNLEFKDSLTNANLSVFETGSPAFDPVKTVQFEESLASYEPDAAVRPLSTIPGKEFAGWFEDPECQTPFDFNSTMPNHDHVVYAGWKDVYYLIKVDPNGGQLDPSESTFFWLTYGKTVSEYGGIKRDFVEVDDGTGTHKYTNNTYDKLHADLVAGTYSDDLAPMTPDEATAYIWDHYKEVDRSAIYEQDSAGTYKAEANAYALIGWYNVNADGSLGTPYDFDNEVSSDVSIRAMWRRLGDFGVVYDLGAVDREGNPLKIKDADGNATQEQVQAASVPTDANRYADQSDSSMFEKAVSPAADKYVFVGWYYDGKIYNPGDVYIINAKLADENKYIHIQPVFDEVESVPVRVTHITWYDNFTVNPVENTNYKTDDDLQINANVEIESSTLFSRPGYRFLGWARVDTTDAQGNAIAGYKLAPQDLDRDDLYLTWHEADATHTNGYYTVNHNGVDKEVTHVAADEIYPYHDMYAVWELSHYYVYHTGSGRLYAFEADGHAPNFFLNFDNGHVEYPNAEMEYLYGGYSTTYYANMTITDAQKTAAASAANGYTTIDAYKYIPSACFTSGGTRYKWWKSMDSLKPVDSTLVAQAGNVYFVKEVSTDYLTSRIQFVYENWSGENKLESMYFLSVLDNKLYDSAWFKLGNTKMTIVSSFNFVEQSNKDNPDPKPSTKTTKATDFSNITYGFVGYANMDEALSSYMSGGYYSVTGDTEFSVTPYWKTVDGIEVEGTARKFDFNANNNAAGDYATKDSIGEVKAKP